MCLGEDHRKIAGWMNKGGCGTAFKVHVATMAMAMISIAYANWTFSISSATIHRKSVSVR